jgi:hypothetical protein
MESVSDAGLLISYDLEGDTLTMSRPTGLRYKAKLDGTVAPYEGDPEKHGVSVRRMTVAAGGKSMTIVVKDIQAETSSQFTATKQ